MEQDDPDTSHTAQGTAKQRTATSAGQRERLLSLIQGPRFSAVFQGTGKKANPRLKFVLQNSR